MKIKELLENQVDVKNIEGTSDKKCNKCGPWIKHWENISGRTAKKCSVIGCAETTNLVGGHVLKCESEDQSHYIVPLCGSHNQVDDKCFTILSADLVSAKQCP